MVANSLHPVVIGESRMVPSRNYDQYVKGLMSMTSPVTELLYARAGHFWHIALSLVERD